MTCGKKRRASIDGNGVAVENGGVAVVDARILPGYGPATAAAMARGNKTDRDG